MNTDTDERDDYLLYAYLAGNVWRSKNVFRVVVNYKYLVTYESELCSAKLPIVGWKMLEAAFDSRK
jgi:hypothetical protein